jgi:hypothetical protein
MTALEAEARLLREHGADVEEVEVPPDFEELLHCHRIWLTSEGRRAFLPEYSTARKELDDFLVGHVEKGTEPRGRNSYRLLMAMRR